MLEFHSLEGLLLMQVTRKHLEPPTLATLLFLMSVHVRYFVHTF